MQISAKSRGARPRPPVPPSIPAQIAGYSPNRRSTPMDFLAWHNILFLSALAVGLLIVIGAAFGLDLGDADVDAEPEMDTVVNFEGAGKGLLSVLDLGQIPFTVLLMVASLIFGLTGVGSSLVFTSTLGGASPWLGLISVAIALAVMVFLTTHIARLIIKHLPASETHVSTKADLVGSEATMFTKVFADLQLRGDVHRIECRSDSPLQPGMRVTVLDYDPETQTYGVSPLPQ
jgi:hypothetical protein